MVGRRQRLQLFEEEDMQRSSFRKTVKARKSLYGHFSASKGDP